MLYAVMTNIAIACPPVCAILVESLTSTDFADCASLRLVGTRKAVMVSSGAPGRIHRVFHDDTKEITVFGVCPRLWPGLGLRTVDSEAVLLFSDMDPL